MNNPLILAGGTIQSENSLTIANPVSLANNAIVTIGNSVNAPLSFAAPITLQGSNQFTISNVGGTTFSAGFTESAASPGAALILAGAGTVDLPVGSTYTGGTTIGTGTNGPIVMLGQQQPAGPRRAQPGCRLAHRRRPRRRSVARWRRGAPR